MRYSRDRVRWKAEKSVYGREMSEQLGHLEQLAVDIEELNSSLDW